MNVRIVDKAIKKIAGGVGILWDTEIPGFGVRVTAAGAVSFILNYRIFNRERRYTIGRWPELTATAARNQAIELRKQIREGQDPMEQRRELRQEPTFSDLLDDFLNSDELRKKRASTLREYRRMIERIVRPRLGSLRLKAVNRRDIAALHAALKETPYVANRCLALLSSIFNDAMREKWVAENPVKGIERYHEEKRERFLSEEEIARFHQALEDYVRQHQGTRYAVDAQNAVHALRMLLLTGARMSEVLKATWEQFHLERGVWVKPSAHTKQKRTEHVPLSQPVLELLKSMQPGSGPLFVGKDGSAARTSIRRPWIAACKGAGLVTVEVVRGKRRHEVKKYKPLVRIHDLRHNYASYLASTGASMQDISKLLGHTQIATTQRYVHHFDKNLRDATNAAGKVLQFERKLA